MLVFVIKTCQVCHGSDRSLNVGTECLFCEFSTGIATDGPDSDISGYQLISSTWTHSFYLLVSIFMYLRLMYIYDAPTCLPMCNVY